MNSEKFVDILKEVVRDSAVEGTIENLEDPPGRSPRKKDLELSEYYNSKSEEEKEKIIEIMKEVAHDVMFGFFCVLDGVRTIEDSEDKGDLILNFKKDGKIINLNENEDLHEIYNSDMSNFE